MATVIITVNTYEAPDIFLVSCGLLLVTTVVCWWFMWLAGLTGRPLCWDVTMSTASVMARCMILLDCAAWCILSCSLRRCKVKTSWPLWQQFRYILLRIKIDLGNQKRYRTCCNFAYFKHSVSKPKHDSKWCDNSSGAKEVWCWSTITGKRGLIVIRQLSWRVRSGRVWGLKVGKKMDLCHSITKFKVPNLTLS